MVKTCQVCALARKMKLEATYFCFKHNRVRQPDETTWDWGCFYFTKIMPEETYTPYQYLLITETELATRK
jgi:hypothetical protein